MNKTATNIFESVIKKPKNEVFFIFQLKSLKVESIQFVS